MEDQVSPCGEASEKPLASEDDVPEGPLSINVFRVLPSLSGLAKLFHISAMEFGQGLKQQWKIAPATLLGSEDEVEDPAPGLQPQPEKTKRVRRRQRREPQRCAATLKPVSPEVQSSCCGEYECASELAHAEWAMDS